MPGRPRRSRREKKADKVRNPNRTRAVAAVVIVVLLVLVLSMRALATFWTDYLWFDSLDRSSVWRALLGSKVTLGAATTLVFFVLLYANLIIADRLAPRFVPSGGAEEEMLERYRQFITGRQRLVFFVVSLVVAIVPGFSASASWQDWLLFRNGGSFGVDDPQFGEDIGFFVFKLPFLSQVVDWAFGFLIVTTILVAVVHYLDGGIRIQPMGERVTPNAKRHLSVLLAMAALVKAADYWLQRYELTFVEGSTFDGAGYTAVKARLPAIQLLLLVSLLAAVLLLINIWRRGWVLPVVVVALWGLTALVVGSIYPAVIQRFQVTPSELAKEKPYIERNIEATRVAMGLNDVEQTDFDYDPSLTVEKVAAQNGNLTDARLLDPSIMKSTIENLQVKRGYFTFKEVDVDRYKLGPAGAERQTPVIIATRELNPADIPDPTWEKEHLVYSHGYAAAMAPANAVDSGGQPDFVVRDIPVQVSGLEPIDKPEIYIGEGMTDYSVVGTKIAEQSEEATDAEAGGTKYSGKDGVSVGGFFRRAAFALRFGETNMLISSYLSDDSKVIFRRDIRERVQELAPFLTLDTDPYPVILDGRIKYVIDGYTSTSVYPYSEHVDFRGSSANYIRNSVKAVVDAYDGTVTMYLTDTLIGGKQDPIIRAYAKAFPDLFQSKIPENLVAHFRYPETLFETQASVWGRYHQSDPATFFTNSDRWNIAQQPPDSTSRETAAAAVQPTAQLDRIQPYYQQMTLSPGGESEFVLTIPFVRESSTDSVRNLTSVMIARNDPGTYGSLQQIEMVTKKSDGSTDQNTDVNGPLQANNQMATYQPVSEYQTLVGRSGSSIQFGNMLILPFDNSLLYMRPVYAKEEQSGRYTLQRVVVASGERTGFGETLELAVEDLFNTDEEGNPVDGSTPTTLPPNGSPDANGSTTTTTPGSTPQTATELLAEADKLLTDAESNLKSNGDLGAYQDSVRRAQDLITRATSALGTATTAPTTTAPETTVPDTTVPG